MKTSCAWLIGVLTAGWVAAPAAAQDVKAIVGATTPVPATATVIDARGKFVMAGLADMHNHVQSGSFRQQQNLAANLSVLLASGVTTVLNPSASLTDFAALKRETAAESAGTPRFFGTGPIVTVAGDAFGAAVGSPTPGSAADARATVATLKTAGVDAIKVSVDGSASPPSSTIPRSRRRSCRRCATI